MKNIINFYKKHHKILIISFLLIIVISLLSGTYAMFQRIDKAEYANRLRIGSATRSEETYRKLLDRVLFHEAMFVFIQNSGKNFGSLFVHGRGNSWIETVPSMILNWKNKAEREELFQQWCNSMRKAASMVFFSGWQRFVAKVVSITRSKLLVRLLCVLPYKLKCRGFHR